MQKAEVLRNDKDASTFSTIFYALKISESFE